jgi:hypothetical protein
MAPKWQKATTGKITPLKKIKYLPTFNINLKEEFKFLVKITCVY